MTKRIHHGALLAFGINALAQLSGGSLRAAPAPPPDPDGTTPPLAQGVDRDQPSGPDRATPRALDAVDTPPRAPLEGTAPREQPRGGCPCDGPAPCDGCPEPDAGGSPAGAEPIAPERPLHDAGAKLARDFVCRGEASCLERHGERLRRAAHTIVDVCLSDPEIPRYVCLGFVANISNEGGGLAHPSCAGLDQACVRRCDTLWTTRARRTCFLRCARAQGMRPGTRGWRAVGACNDGGSSRGPFQMKHERVDQCRALLGDDFDPFDLEQAVRCTLRLVKRSATARYWPCGKRGDRWLVAMKRIGAGVLRKVAAAEVGRLVPDLAGGLTWIPPRPAVWVPICQESGYGLRGLRYYRACGARCANAAPIDSACGD